MILVIFEEVFKMRECKQCNTQMEEGYVIKVTTYGTPFIERGKIGFPSNLGTKGGEIKAAMCPNCGEISLYNEKESK
jgi:RNase P subunit RPR2